MTIANLKGRIKGRLSMVPKDVLVFGIIVLSSSGSFGLGYLSGTNAAVSAPSVEITPEAASVGEGKFVASKNGTRYYLPWCGGANRISEENAVWFENEEAAQKAGYAPATNCDGL